ncbi:DNase I-like protein [Trametes sanguinea]|nr:DNase I-like protein [Trametes sanguinea]
MNVPDNGNCPVGTGDARGPTANSRVGEGYAGVGGSGPGERVGGGGEPRCVAAGAPSADAGSPGPGRAQASDSASRSTKNRLRIATLNIKGYGHEDRTNGSSKWLLINQLIRQNRIGVLALQETHLDNARAETLDRIFGADMTVLRSEDPENSTAARGVAFVVNKRIVKEGGDIKFREIIEGRAATLTIPRKGDEPLCVLNVYGPNNGAQNAAFWDELKAKQIGRVDLMLGDFNVAEDAIDRIPARADSGNAVGALRSLRASKNLTDLWRAQNPATKVYTYMQTSSGSQSRLDRIYANGRIACDLDGWAHEEPGIPTDHKLVSVQITNRREPFIGKGRWSMPTHLINDEVVKKAMKELGARLCRDIAAIRERTDNCNPQKVYARFKEDLTKSIRDRAKCKIPKIKRKIDRLREALELVLNETSDNAEDIERRKDEAAEIQER